MQQLENNARGTGGHPDQVENQIVDALGGRKVISHCCCRRHQSAAERVKEQHCDWRWLSEHVFGAFKEDGQRDEVGKEYEEAHTRKLLAAVGEEGAAYEETFQIRGYGASWKAYGRYKRSKNWQKRSLLLYYIELEDTDWLKRLVVISYS